MEQFNLDLADRGAQANVIMAANTGMLLFISPHGSSEFPLGFYLGGNWQQRRMIYKADVTAQFTKILVQLGECANAQSECHRVCTSCVCVTLCEGQFIVNRLM